MEDTENPQERTHGRSEEEVDLLVRSNKKVRSEAPPTSHLMEDTKMTAGNQKETSFRDMLMGRPNEPMEEDEEQTPEEDQDQDCPIIHVSMEEKRRIRRPWKKTLIIKLLGRNIGSGADVCGGYGGLQPGVF